MRINALEKSYVNTSGEIYDSEFINLVNVKDNKIAFDERTLFLTKSEKELLNTQQIKDFNDVVYIFKYKGVYGVVCDIPIQEYEFGNIKCHELVLPDTVQGMLSNLHDYNCEAAPILLAHKEGIRLSTYIEGKRYTEYFNFNDIEIYVLSGKEAKSIAKEYQKIENLYVADGHHRLYTSSLSGFKSSALSCLISFEYLDILPIHRLIPNVDAQLYERAKEFIHNRFEILAPYTSLTKGTVRIQYDGESFAIKLIDLNSDAFWNNDIYRLNTQIISQAFRIFDTGNLKYISEDEIKEHDLSLGKNDVFIQTHAVGKEEFVECANNNSIMPPKSTWFSPKFPSLLIIKQYK